MIAASFSESYFVIANQDTSTCSAKVYGLTVSPLPYISSLAKEFHLHI